MEDNTEIVGGLILNKETLKVAREIERKERLKTSDCCDAPVRVCGGCDDFYTKTEHDVCTMHYECTKCQEPCNIKPKEEKEND